MTQRRGGTLVAPNGLLIRAATKCGKFGLGHTGLRYKVLGAPRSGGR